MTSDTRGAACAVTGSEDPSGPRTRTLFLLAGSITLIGVLLSATVSRWFLLVPGLVGANQLLMAATGRCPVSLVLDRMGIDADRPIPTGPPSTT